MGGCTSIRQLRTPKIPREEPWRDGHASTGRALALLSIQYLRWACPPLPTLLRKGVVRGKRAVPPRLPKLVLSRISARADALAPLLA